MRKLLIGVGVVIALSALGLIAPAYADAVLFDGNKPCAQPLPGTIDCKNTEEIVNFIGGDQGPVDPGTAIVGNTNRSDTAVDFVSTTDHLMAKGGQSDLDATTKIHNVTILLPGGTLFGDLIINPMKPLSDISVTVHAEGETKTESFPEHGSNFITIRASSSTNLLESVTIDVPGGFQDLKQTRISAIEGVAPIPEPSTFLLVGSGLLAFLLIQKKGRLVSFER